MKKRIITAIVAVIGAIVIILLSEINSIFLLVPICAFCVISVHELIGVIKIKSKMLKATSMVYAGIVPFLVAGDASYAGFFGKSIPINLHTILILVTILYVLVVLHSLLKHYTSVKFETVATLMFGTIVVSLGLSLLPAFHALYHYYPNVRRTSARKNPGKAISAELSSAKYLRYYTLFYLIPLQPLIISPLCLISSLWRLFLPYWQHFPLWATFPLPQSKETSV